jgi:hypothetical protein
MADTPTPTQVKHPWRSTVRTVFQALVGLASLLPYVVTEAHIPVEGMAAQAVAVCAATTRIMAMPPVAEFLTRFVPWLAPASKPPAND